MQYLPLLPMLKYPANAAYINEQIRELVFFDMIPTEQLEESTFYKPEEEPYSTNMSMFGFESKLLVANAGIGLWMIFWFLLLIIVFALFYKIPFCRRRLGKYLFWNTLVRLLTEVYLEMLMLAALNLRTVEWSSAFSYVSYSNSISIAIILALITIPIILTFYYFRRREDWSSPTFEDKHGALFEGIRMNTRLVSRQAVIFYIMSYFLRRVIFVIALFLFENTIWP